ncbi:hypothetical protein JANAI62_01930 [Jannaschia pagri]|uniref:DUF4178 domain-containing protein n=2 Tax=Roseobacteraceae TaxID=2854170 RepID=A0ABQ4NHC2_9RHOB|nr:hypothetical protein JANAI61_07820 [Jannaschia sp. AI_61]GIT93570.1 hypothetical protein JANAI62_01930 [Jannaschia sp. AI_62]
MLAHARMVNCEFCGSSVVLEDAVLRKAGEAGEMLEAPELIGIGVPVELGSHGAFVASGHVRYDYGRGHWDEYHGTLGTTGGLAWVSVDEGDVVLQREVPPSRMPQGGREVFRLGAEVSSNGVFYACSEVSNAKAIAFRGQLPEPVAIGDTHLFANFSGPRGAFLSGEIWDGGIAWFAGHWIDPFDVRRVL